MAYEWIAPLATGVVGLAGITTTWLAGRGQADLQRKLFAREHREQRARSIQDRRASVCIEYLAELEALLWHARLRLKMFDSARSILQKELRQHVADEFSIELSKESADKLSEELAEKMEPVLAYDVDSGLAKLIRLNSAIRIWATPDVATQSGKCIGDAMSVAAELLRLDPTGAVDELSRSTEQLANAIFVDLHIEPFEPGASLNELLRKYEVESTESTRLTE
ncbi:hypothetical protein [Phytoactinopolyspora limicola]|uniref:hypothetical protein n=1 Tax=Phytoactinopolyspora limicola TaxID=2715536 RepID=UPI00140A55FB|nr:hypothetical protein [Phytoactinopolyspora limicola]